MAFQGSEWGMGPPSGFSDRRERYRSREMSEANEAAERLRQAFRDLPDDLPMWQRDQLFVYYS